MKKKKQKLKVTGCFISEWSFKRIKSYLKQKDSDNFALQKEDFYLKQDRNLKYVLTLKILRYRRKT